MPIPAGTTDGGGAAAAGAAGDVDDGLPPPAPIDGEVAGRLSDEELVAGLEAEEKGEQPPAKDEKKPDPKASKKKDEKAPDGKEPEVEVEVKLDAAASKGIEATNRYRQQVERQLQRREETIVKREQELAPRLAKLEAYEKSLASRDPVAVAEALGYGADELETLAHTLYKMSKSASPADRAAAAAALRQRQTSTATEKLEKEIADLKASIQERDQRAQQQAFVQQYTTELTSAVVPDEHPLVANALKNAPAPARQELLQLAAQLERANGNRTPEPADVLKAYEGVLRRQAQALGFDPSKLGKQDTNGTTTTPTPDNGQKKTTATLRSDLGPQTRPRSAPKSRDEGFDETLRELEELERKGRRA